MVAIHRHQWGRELAELANDPRRTGECEAIAWGRSEEKVIHIAQISSAGIRPYMPLHRNGVPSETPVAVECLRCLLMQAKKVVGDEDVTYVHDGNVILMNITPSMAKDIHRRFVHHPNGSSWAFLRFVEPLEEFEGNPKRHPSRISMDNAAQGLGRLRNKLQECRNGT